MRIGQGADTLCDAAEARAVSVAAVRALVLFHRAAAYLAKYPAAAAGAWVSEQRGRCRTIIRSTNSG